MSVIQSALGGARLKATALKSATNSLIQSQSAVKDNPTTVAGNNTAKESIKSAQDTERAIGNAVSLASANIQSVAENFEAMDSQSAQTLRKSIGGLLYRDHFLSISSQN